MHQPWCNCILLRSLSDPHEHGRRDSMALSLMLRRSRFAQNPQSQNMISSFQFEWPWVSSILIGLLRVSRWENNKNYKRTTFLSLRGIYCDIERIDYKKKQHISLVEILGCWEGGVSTYWEKPRWLSTEIAITTIYLPTLSISL